MLYAKMTVAQGSPQGCVAVRLESIQTSLSSMRTVPPQGIYKLINGWGINDLNWWISYIWKSKVLYFWEICFKKMLVFRGVQGRRQWYGQYDHGRTSFGEGKNGVALIQTYACIVEWPH